MHMAVQLPNNHERKKIEAAETILNSFIDAKMSKLGVVGSVTLTSAPLCSESYM